MLFYNAGPCYPGGLVDSVTDSGGGVQGSYPNIDTFPLPPVKKFCFKSREDVGNGRKCLWYIVSPPREEIDFESGRQ